MLGHEAQPLLVVEGAVAEAELFEGGAAGGEDLARRAAGEERAQVLDAERVLEQVALLVGDIVLRKELFRLAATASGLAPVQRDRFRRHVFSRLVMR